MSKKTSSKWFFAGYLGVAVTMAALASLYGSKHVQDLYEQQTREDLEVRARLCSKQIIELLQQDETQAVDDLCKELGKVAGTRITAIRPSGKVVGDTDEDPDKMENHSDRPEIQQALKSALKNSTGVGHSTRNSATLEKTLMYVAVAVPKGNAPVAVVRASIPITTVHDRLAAVAQAFLIVALLTALLIAVAIPWFSIRFTPVAKDAK
ncbi:MAG: hypothetical protein HQ567_27065 [Candidatus Nealsonbacteria bacterium]|nr:hypothetical protein [Candidatus Nealsonbacteria bacterium]